MQYIRDIQEVLNQIAGEVFRHHVRWDKRTSIMDQILLDADVLKYHIGTFLDAFNYTDRGYDLPESEINETDGNRIFLRETLWTITDQLEDTLSTLVYLTSRVIDESVLRKGPDGKYRTETGIIYDMGDYVEALLTDERHEAPYWSRCLVGYNGDDYCLVGLEDLPLEGLRVRIRGSA